MNSESQCDSAGRRFPEPVADLVVKRLRLARLHDVRVVAQPVKQLRTVRLTIDRFQLVVLVERVALGPLGNGMLVRADAFPRSGERRERSEVGECVGVSVRFGVDVRAVGSVNRAHTRSLHR